MDWARLEPPSLDAFESVARDAFAALPQEFRELAGNIVFQIHDFPEPAIVEEMELDSEFEILGLYQGADHATLASNAAHGTQTMIFLFRRPILDYWSEGQDSLGRIVRHVLVHEIGHHLGLSDEEMDRIESAD